MTNRRPSKSRILRDAPILKRISELKADHPFFGYRRIWAHLKFIDGLNINQKRVYRLMKAHDLLVKDNIKLKAKRTSQHQKPRPTKPNE